MLEMIPKLSLDTNRVKSACDETMLHKLCIRECFKIIEKYVFSLTSKYVKNAIQ